MLYTKFLAAIFYSSIIIVICGIIGVAYNIGAAEAVYGHYHPLYHGGEVATRVMEITRNYFNMAGQMAMLTVAAAAASVWSFTTAGKRYKKRKEEKRERDEH